MSNMGIHISLSRSYAAGFTNAIVGLEEFAALTACRLFHYFDEKLVNNYARTFYQGNSECYHWLCLLKYQNQFTGDLLARKNLRAFLKYQYVFYDIHPECNLKRLVNEIEVRPNILTVTGNGTARLFYILDIPQPLTSYKSIYGHFLAPVARLGLVLDCSTPKVIRADRGAVINPELHPTGFINELY